MKISRYQKNAPQDEVSTNNGKCEVWGCGLTGSLSSAPNSPWYCRFHYGIKLEHQTPITLQIKHYMSLINILDVCIRPDIKYTNYANAEHEVKSYLIKKELLNLYSEGNLYKTSQNILSFLHNKIKPIQGE